VLTQAQRAEMSLEQFRAEFCLPFTIFYDRHVPHVPLPNLRAGFTAVSARCKAPSANCRMPVTFWSFAARASSRPSAKHRARGPFRGANPDHRF
jgi:hypothetical protein